MGFFDSDWRGLKGQCPQTPSCCDSLRVKSSRGTLDWALPSRGYMFHRDKGKMSQAQGLYRSRRSEAETKTGKTK